MTTANDIINDALQASGVIGIGQIPLAENSNLALRLLNRMIGQWNRRRWLVYHLVENSLTCDGSTFYTIRSGGNFNIARPDRIEKAWFVQNTVPTANAISYQLQELSAYEDYARIALKGLQSFGYMFFYDSGYPTGKIYPWPILNNTYTLHILTKDVLSTLAGLQTTVSLPPEYEEAIMWNLAQKLRPMFQLEPDMGVDRQAAATLNTIRGANAQIARLGMPAPLNRNSIYNIFSDQNGSTT